MSTEPEETRSAMAQYLFFIDLQFTKENFTGPGLSAMSPDSSKIVTSWEKFEDFGKDKGENFDSE